VVVDPGFSFGPVKRAQLEIAARRQAEGVDQQESGTCFGLAGHDRFPPPSDHASI